MLDVTQAPDGNVLLHMWRDGDEYVRQKGELFLNEWTNVRFVGVPKPPVDNVYHVDLSREPLEFPTDTFDAVNAYHIFEHLTPEEGARLAAEVSRVLKPGGVFRVSVPDLEDICRSYLYHLGVAVEDRSLQNIRRYRWTVMEIFEQMVREKTGGRMLEALKSGDYDREYLEGKYSDVYRPLLAAGAAKPPATGGSASRSRSSRFTPKAVYRRLTRRLRRRATGDMTDPAVTRERVRWMYDRLSLRFLLEEAGFVEIQQTDFKHSGIPNWDRYDLDCSSLAERPIDPSVYVEGRKPESASPVLDRPVAARA
ncbi:MAG: methyltransferase domain-containing protein [Gemmatimonadota bacterium]